MQNQAHLCCTTKHIYVFRNSIEGSEMEHTRLQELHGIFNKLQFWQAAKPLEIASRSPDLACVFGAYGNVCQNQLCAVLLLRGLQMHHSIGQRHPTLLLLKIQAPGRFGGYRSSRKLSGYLRFIGLNNVGIRDVGKVRWSKCLPVLRC
jgi:hypothetical protein